MSTMMDWDEATRAARGFMRGILGPGYVPEYYQQFADEIVALMKACETPDPEPVHTHDAGEYRDPSTGEVVPSTRGELTFTEAMELLVQYRAEKAEKATRTTRTTR